MNILGIISGSSLDGLDIALCRFEGDTPESIRWSIVKAVTISFDDNLAKRLNGATKLPAKELMDLEVTFSKFCVEVVTNFIEGIDLQVDYISSHGHTIFHNPESGFTFQLGKGSILAEGLGIPCISDLRSNDVALGGQGAPFAPIVEQWLYPGYDYYINLGGIANVSFHGSEKITSIDSCPCNQVLNYLMSDLSLPYDDKGNRARKGTVNVGLLKSLGNLKYFDQPLPKSMDNSWVTEVFIPQLANYKIKTEDKLATMVAFIASQLALDTIGLTPQSDRKQSVLVTGGGAFNDFLVEQVKNKLGAMNIALHIPDADTINFKEAVLISLMGYLRVLKIPNTISTVTGAAHATIGGAVYWPSGKSH